MEKRGQSCRSGILLQLQNRVTLRTLRAREEGTAPMRKLGDIMSMSVIWIYFGVLECRRTDQQSSDGSVLKLGCAF